MGTDKHRLKNVSREVGEGEILLRNLSALRATLSSALTLTPNTVTLLSVKNDCQPCQQTGGRA
jgi:hypothetical protein